jgi:RNA-binding protein
MPLTGNAARSLRALAHDLKPVVHVGKNGSNAEVAKAVAQALTDHELIKVKVLRECPITPDEVGAGLADATRSDVAQRIGRIVVLYKPHPKKPKIKIPKGWTPPPKGKKKAAEPTDIVPPEPQDRHDDDDDVEDDGQ